MDYAKKYIGGLGLGMRLWLDSTKQGVDPFRLAFEIGLTNKVDETSKQVIHKVVDLHIGQNFATAPPS